MIPVPGTTDQMISYETDYATSINAHEAVAPAANTAAMRSGALGSPFDFDQPLATPGGGGFGNVPVASWMR